MHGTASKKSTKKKSRSAKTANTSRKVRSGFISHTELASTDPSATKQWCQDVLGWKFGDSMPTPAGPYHLWSFGNNIGGGIRANNPPEIPGSIPYCEVPDVKATFERAIRAGAKEMLPPEGVPGGNRWFAVVQAPGGVAIGFWGPK